MFNETNQVFPAEFSSAVFIGGDAEQEIVVVKLRYDGNTFTPEADDYIDRIATAYDNCKPIVLIANTGSNGEDRHYYLTERYPHNNGVDVVFAFQCNTGAETDVIYIDSVGDFEREVIANGSGGSPNAVLYTKQDLSDEQKAQARENIGVPETVEASGYRHIATYEHTADEGVQQIDITQDKDGNAFSCSDFLIFLTLPTSQDIADGYKTQLYVGHELWKNWDIHIKPAFSRTATRKWRIHFRHSHDGWWVANGSYNESDLTYSIPDYTYSVGNVKSATAVGKTISQLHFYAQSAFNKGTIIEIYGK